MNHFPEIHRSVLHKITIDLLYFRDVYVVKNLRKNEKMRKNLDTTNVFIYFHHFKEKTMDTDED